MGMKMILSLLAAAAAAVMLMQGVNCGKLKMPKVSMDDGYKGGSWQPAHATFYGDETAKETMGGACGYGNLYSSGYGTDTAALSTVLFKNGYGCGECFEIRCVESKHCLGGESITITATNLCPPNYNQANDDGGWCNPPREHFDLSKPAFMKLAYWKAGIIPVMYHRVPCIKKGGLAFTMAGNSCWALIYITNVGGPGDIASVSIKGDKGDWIPMSKNWGVAFQVFKNFKGQSLSFSITSYTTKRTIILNNVVPSTWVVGKTYKTDIQLE